MMPESAFKSMLLHAVGGPLLILHCDNGGQRVRDLSNHTL